MALRTLALINGNEIRMTNLTTIANKLDHTSLQIAFALGKLNRVKYISGQKIRVLFVFQAASFWPSWETVWEHIITDDRFDVQMILCDDGGKEKVQFKTAAKFLEQNGISYKHFNEFNITEFNPHVVFLHTPYDGHRPRSLHAKNLALCGYRLIYIPYGIEISDIPKARSDHFHLSVTNLAWRVYTFSQQIIPYYKMFSRTTGENVRAFGHPRFDVYNQDNKPSMPPEIEQRAKGRPVLILKVHFPKKVGGKFITPDVGIYKHFLKKMAEYRGVFVVFMPHPKFYEQLAKYENINTFKNTFKDLENVLEYTDDDYRPVFINADYHIVDRSALMVEAGYTEKPILYVKSSPEEKMTKPVERIVSSYYQADRVAELFDFVETIVMQNADPLRDDRLQVVYDVIPPKDLSSAALIVNDIASSIEDEGLEQNDHSDGEEFLLGHIFEIIKHDEIAGTLRKRDARQVKNHLSYRLGAEMVKASKSVIGLLRLPYSLVTVYRNFKNDVK